MTSMPHETTPSLTDPNHYRSFDNINMVAVESKGSMPTRPWVDTEPEQPSSSETTRRKRLSFFGRTSSEASTRKQQSLQATTPVSKSEAVQAAATPEPQPRRPMTAGSEHGRRKTTDQLESIRHSIFGGKKSAATPRPTTKRSRHSHQAELKKPNLSLVPFASSLHEEAPQPEVKGNAGAQDFRSESDFYHHRKKTSISSPFNFHHVGHTGRKNLPTRLETVDEKALANKFLDFDAQGHQLQGIPADKVRHSRIGVPKALPPMQQAIPSRHRNSPSVDETTFDETSDTKFNVDEHFNERPALRSPDSSRRHSSPHSSSAALNSPAASSASHTTPLLNPKASFERSFACGQLPQSDRRPTIPARGRPLGQSFRENQPLPPVPPQAAAAIGRKPSKASLASSRQSIGQLFPAPPSMKVGYPASIASQISKRSSKSAAPTVQSTSTRAFSDIPVGVDWEDDIDFAFEQEAESTCDFDWEKYTPYLPAAKEELSIPSPDDESPDSSGSGGVRLSDWIDEPSALESESKHRSTTSTPGTSPSNDDDALPLNHKRGPSVGHLGFLAARNASSDKLAKTPPLQVEIKNSEESTPPTFSITAESADQELKSPCPSQTYFPAFDSTIPEYLSDPESTRLGGSHHRKSSSYGSFESSGRSLQTASASDSTRWSSASTSSIPDLLHSYNQNSRKRSSVRKSTTSGSFRILESVPHSPDGRGEHKFDAKSPERPTLPDRSTSEGFIMRRPATSEDRALLFQSGRVAQRGRSSTSCRMAIQSLPADDLEGG